MSRPVPEQVRQLEADVQDLQVRPAAEVRARGRQRGRRQLTAVLAGVAVVATTAGITATRTFTKADPQATAPEGLATACVLELPSSPADVRIRVFDGGAPGDTEAQFRERRFTVLTAGGADMPRIGPSTLRYGPAAIGAAAFVKAVVVGDVTMKFDPARAGDVIDLTLGSTFTRLATATEINQALVTAGEPTAPPGC